MARNWELIREARRDITDWVIHWTHGRVYNGQPETPRQVLQHILRCGYL